MNITQPINISIIAHNFFEFKNLSLIILPQPLNDEEDIFGAFSIITLFLCLLEIIGIGMFIYFCIKRAKQRTA